MKQPIVIKVSGDREPFSETKYRASLRRSGASGRVINEIRKEIAPLLRGEITTSALYRETRRLLKSKQRSTAGRYSLKQALIAFGPSGYPFEKFVAGLLEYRGYTTQINKIMRGKCVTHEVDVFAYKKDYYAMVECKFHNHASLRSGVKTSLYIKARFDDINEYAEESKKKSCSVDDCWLVTNTKFSDDAITYGTCRNITLLAWAYPRGKGIESMIDECGLHPVTCLTRLTRKDAQVLLAQGVVFAKDIYDNEEILKKLRFGSAKIKSLIQEARQLSVGT